MTQYISRRIATQEIEAAAGRRDPDDFVGPIDVPPVPEDGCELIPYQGFVPLDGRPTPTSVLRSAWPDGPADPYWVEEANLEDLKARKRIEINEARLLANQSYFDFADKEIACDEVSMLDIQCINAEVSLTRKIPVSFPGYWKARDNTYTSIPDVATWTLFIQAMVTRGSTHFAHAQQLKADLAVATTPAQVASITW